MIRIEHLVKDYIGKKASYRALKGISLTLPDVQFVSILGPSGCGKTTLLNLLGGLDSITEGDIQIDGRSLKTMTSRELDAYRNDSVGFIFQDYFLIPQLNVLENVKIGLQVRGVKDDEAQEKAKAILERLGIDELSRKKPNELSGGQTQRVAIARALATDPKIILADEPTGALDSKNSESIMALLKEESKRRLVVLVTHNEDLAKRYSDRIVRIKDGRLESDSLPMGEEKKQTTEEKAEGKSHLPFLTTIKLAFKNLFKKKVKTALTCVANSFGMVGIGFFLALNTGFSDYSMEMSRITASSLPVILTSYTTVSDSEAYGDVNNDVLYPDVDEIYPIVSTNSTSSYVFNNFTDKFFSYLDTLKEEGLVSEYVINYGNSYSLNLTTEYPSSLDGTKDAYVGTVNTTQTSSNSITSTTGLPTSVFHPLYGGLEDYDCLAGKAPENDHEIILVVDKYNSVSFSILKNLGFYNSSDSKEDVRSQGEDGKVRPIAFSDILGKEYKIFENDAFFQETGTKDFTDAFGNTRKAKTFTTKDLSSLYQDSSSGETLRIVGIYRAKKDNEFGLLSPSLCYLSSLQEGIVQENLQSDLASAFQDNVVFAPGKSVLQFASFLKEMNDTIEPFVSGESTVLPTSSVKSILDRYFAYVDYRSSENLYTISSMVSQAKKLGIELIPDSLKGLTLSDSKKVVGILEDIQAAINKKDFSTFYQMVIGLCAYVNAYSFIDYVTILPTSLATRATILERLDSFNDIVENSTSHASSTKEQVFYSSMNASHALEQVAEVIDMASLILIVFAVISLTVSAAMTAVLTTNNVLERRKEIGLLRSLGSRKLDILILFELETLFIGVFTGLFGALATYVLTFPVNLMINSYFPAYGATHIAQFLFPHVLILLAFSLVVSFLSAFIPSLKAAKEDPVKCLRSD